MQVVSACNTFAWECKPTHLLHAVISTLASTNFFFLHFNFQFFRTHTHHILYLVQWLHAVFSEYIRNECDSKVHLARKNHLQAYLLFLFLAKSVISNIITVYIKGNALKRDGFHHIRGMYVWHWQCAFRCWFWYYV